MKAPLDEDPYSGYPLLKVSRTRRPTALQRFASMLSDAPRTKIIALPRERIPSIETFRVIAVFAIILIHSEPYASLREMGDSYQIIASLLEQLTRFAVPYFLIAGGYFYGKSLNASPKPSTLLANYVKRLGCAYLGWWVIYGVLPLDWGSFYTVGVLRQFYVTLSHAVSIVREEPYSFIFHGTMFHLWFIPHLILSVSLLSILVILKLQRLVIPIGFLLYAAFLLNSAYRDVLPSTYHVVSPWRFNLFLFVALGWWLTQHRERSLAFAMCLITFGYTCHVIEAAHVASLFSAGPSRYDGTWFLIGTVPLGVGVFLLTLSRPHLGSNSKVTSLAKLTFGIYLSHMLVLGPIKSVARLAHIPFYEVLLPFIVFTLSALLTFYIAQDRRLSWLVGK